MCGRHDDGEKGVERKWKVLYGNIIAVSNNVVAIGEMVLMATSAALVP